MASSKWGSVALLAAVAMGCGGGDEQPPAGTPAGQAADVAQPVAGVETGGPDTVAVESPPAQDTVPARGTQLVREVFSYRGSGRDPFLSLLRSGEVRPLLEDLRVTTITYNARFPSNSVAVLRDTTVNQRYTVRVGDALGRMRIVEIRPREIVMVVEEFGVERQVVLQQRRRREGQP